MRVLSKLYLALVLQGLFLLLLDLLVYLRTSTWLVTLILRCGSRRLRFLLRVRQVSRQLFRHGFSSPISQVL